MPDPFVTGLLVAILLASCAPKDPPGTRRLDDGEAQGFSVSADAGKAFWIEGHWPDRTLLVGRDLRGRGGFQRRYKGYSLEKTRPGLEPGRVTVSARVIGEGAVAPGAPPKRVALLTVDARSGELLDASPDLGGPAFREFAVVRSPYGDYAAVERPLDSGQARTLYSSPAPIESLLTTPDAVYLLVLSPTGLEKRPGPRSVLKLDRVSGAVLWKASWAGRVSELLARSSDGARLFLAVNDDASSSLWETDDSPRAVEAAGKAAESGAPTARRALRFAGAMLVRVAAGLGAVLLVYFLRRG